MFIIASKLYRVRECGTGRQIWTKNVERESLHRLSLPAVLDNDCFVEWWEDGRLIQYVDIDMTINTVGKVLPLLPSGGYKWV